MGLRRWVGSWPVYRQLTGPDTLGRGRAAESSRSASLAPRTSAADRAVDSVCPYCAVGCAQLVYATGGQVIQIEGNPASPISRGRLCPKGWQDTDDAGNALRRTMGIASLGGA